MTTTPATPTANTLLRSFVERVERLDEEIKGLNDDKRDIYAEARSNGFDVKALKAVIRLRAQDPAEREQLEGIVQTYLSALGMSPDVQGDMTALDAALAGERTTAEAA